MNPVHIVEAEVTCPAVPSQWDAKSSDGKYVYIRYRHSHLSVEVADTEKAWWAGRETIVVDMHVAERWLEDGHCTLRDVSTWTPEWVTFEESLFETANNE